MFKSPSQVKTSLLSSGFLAVVMILGAGAVQAEKGSGYYGYGQVATAEQIAGWDIDVRPDGMGLPEGRGTAEEGEWIYEEKCASCHGSFGEGVDGYPSLAGGEGTLSGDGRPHKTIGSYWNYTSTVFDYINRAMPYTAPRSLEPDEVYSLTAYLLFMNYIIDDETFELNQDTLATVRLPNEPNFIPDERPDTANTRCMSDCRDPAAIEIKSQASPSLAEELAAAQGDSSEAVTESQPAVATVGKSVYDQSCMLCHGSGLAGAPKVGDVEGWRARIAAGSATLYKHAIEGYQGEAGVMPAKGGFMNLSDDDVKAAVDYMVQESL